MPSPSHAAPPPHRSRSLAAWLPSPRSLLWVLAAIVAGLLLFLLVRERGQDNFFRADPNAPTAANPVYAPLPAPIAGERGDVSDIAPAPERERDEDAPRLVETTPPPVPQVATAPAPPAAAGRAIPSSQQEPISSPAPRYPTMALRRGERGTVIVSVEVGPDGMPASVDVATSSGSRLLDRAAVDAVRRWRFRPAMAGEQPVTARVQVPISFQP